jgi:hypothetical protein
MKIAIKFGDNDFGNCFLGVLKTLLSAYRHTETLPTDKIALCNIVNGLSSSCYLLFQDDKLEDRTKEYLQIKPSDLLINEEVDEYSKLTGQHNSDTYVLDTDLDYNNNNAVYFL